MLQEIPEWEFNERTRTIQKELNARDLDALIVHSNEADFANVRYLTDYWPAFESAGAVVPRDGEAILLIGPESETYARDRSKVKRIMKVLEYRESAEPEYPDIKIDTFGEVFDEALGGRKVRRLGIGGYSIMPLPVYDALKAALPETEIVRADDIMRGMRSVKSENEVALLKDSSRIAEMALEQILEKIRPGMTELQVVGIAEGAMYENGAEYEGHPQYVLSGKSSTHAISRPTHKKLREGELIQLDIGARLAGYSSSVGRPMCLGRMPLEMRKLVEAGLELHWKTKDLIREGAVAKDVVRSFMQSAEKKGVRRNVLYGPCHGIGLIEVEPPWMESTSDYALKKNMTFQVDTFLYAEAYGLRWEDGIAVTKDGVDKFCTRWEEVIEVSR
jgi:Xaa-Pro aminopeptidase